MWWALVFLAIFFIGVTKSGFGSGVGLMIVPMVAIALGHLPPGSEAALGLLLPLLIVGDFIALWQYSPLFFAKDLPDLNPENGPATTGATTTAIATKTISSPARARAAVLALLPGTAVGVILGGLLLWFLQRFTNLVGALIRIEIGCESILLVSLHWWRIIRGTKRHLLPEPWRSYLTGAFAAVSSTLAHAAGPIVAMYLLPLKFDRQLYVGVTAVYFFLLNSAKLPAYWASGQFRHAQLSFTIKFLPLVLVGAIFGRWINRRLNDRVFTNIVYGVTFALGWYILADGILRLFGRHIA
jgi:uncharacterized protein